MLASAVPDPAERTKVRGALPSAGSGTAELQLTQAGDAPQRHFRACSKVAGFKMTQLGQVVVASVGSGTDEAELLETRYAQFRQAV